MFFLIYGNDHFRCREQLTELKKQFQQKRDQAGLNIVELDGANINFDIFKQEIMTVPFLGEKKLLVIKNLTKNKDKKISGEILSWLKKHDANPDHAIIFCEWLESKKQLTDELFTYLKNKKFPYQHIWELDLLTPYAAEKWLKNYLNNQKIKIEASALKELVALVGNDLGQLILEIKKLAAYSQNNIAKNDVHLLVKANFDDDIFALIDAIGYGNKKLALKLLAEQLKNGSHPLVILSLIARQFKIIIQVKSQLDQGVNNQYALAKKLGLAPFIISKAIGQAKNFSLKKLLAIYRQLPALDYRLKSGSKNPELLLDLFITQAIDR